MSCNEKRQEETKYDQFLFQSLSGFPMSCNRERVRIDARLFVSIPIGFSNELQRMRARIGSAGS